MREIKFRAWDKRDKDFVNGCVFVGNNGRQYWWQYNMVEPEEFESRLFDIEVNQYAGLKDKNGLEIYEGDIVKCEEHPDGHTTYVGAVEFSGGCFVESYYHRALIDQLSCEIIGNIYENPELLK